MKITLFSTLLLSTLFLVQGFAQEIPLQVQDFLKRTGSALSLPLDSDYKPVYIPEELFQRYDYAIRSGKDEVEIRFLFLPTLTSSR